MQPGGTYWYATGGPGASRSLGTKRTASLSGWLGEGAIVNLSARPGEYMTICSVPLAVAHRLVDIDATGCRPRRSVLSALKPVRPDEAG